MQLLGQKFNLMRVQEEAIARSHGKRGYGYFMEMGLGKTMTSQMDLLRNLEEGYTRRSLVVCPNSFKGGWVKDAEKHSIPVNQFVYVSGQDQYVRSWMRRSSNQIRQLIVNYEALRSDNTMSLLNDYFSGHDVQTIFDESIQLKQYDSLQTKAGIQVGGMSAMVRLLSGKPTTQGPHDLWGQLRAAKQISGFKFHAFKHTFCKMGGFRGKATVGTQREDELRDLLEPIAFYAKKEDWSDLPPKLFTQRTYNMTPQMQAQFDQMYEEFVLWLDEENYVAVDAAITKYIKLAQIQAGFIIQEDGKVVELVEPKKNPRIKLMRQIIDEEVSGKVLVPYHHKYVREILFKAFEDLNPAVLKGQMTVAEQDAEKDRFNNDPRCRIMFLQTKASKYGHTLLGDAENRCSTMIFFENTYSLDDRSQIEDRNHRWGQDADHCLYVDLCGTVIDQRMTDSLANKEEMFQSIFNSMRTRPS